MEKQLHVGARPALFRTPQAGRLWQKPEPAFWTSSLVGRDWSAWLELCRVMEDRRSLRVERWVLEIDPTARVYQLDSRAALLALTERFPGIDIEGESIPDWTRVAREYDGVHVTPAALAECLLGTARPTLYAWDCESAAWFRDVFTSTTPAPPGDKIY